MAVYDDERQKTGASDDELRRITGISPDKEGAMDREAHNGAADDIGNAAGLSPEQLADAESSGATPEATAADKQEAGEDSGGWNTNVQGPSKKSGLRRILGSRNGKIGAGVVTIGIAGVVGLGGILGPTLFINNLRELLLTKVSQLQTDHSLKYRRKYTHKVKDMFTVDGRRSAKLQAEMRAKGYDFKFNRKTGVLDGLIGPDGRGIPNYAIADHLHAYLEFEHPLRTSRWKTKRMEAFYSRYKVTRRPVVVRTADDPEDPERAVNKKIAEDVHGEDIETRLRANEAGGEETDEQEAARERANAEHGEVASSGTGAYDEIKTKLRAGTPIAELTPDERALLRVTGNIDAELLDLLERAGAGSLSSLGRLKSLFSTTDIADKLCTVRNRLAAIETAARLYRSLGLLRYTASFIKVADATRAGKQIDPSMFNVLMKRVTAVDKNGNAIGSSPGMAYILKGKFSKSRNDAAKGSFGVDGKLIGFPAVVDDATNVPGVNNGSCRVLQNPAFQIGVGVIEFGAAVFTGGSSTAAKTPFMEAMKKGIRSMLNRRVARGLATGVAIDMSFEATMALIQLYGEKSTALPSTTQEEGGELGDMLAGGAGTLNKQRSLQAGMVPATTEQYAVAHTTYLAEKEAKQKEQSLFARYFDFRNVDSLAFQTTTSLAFSPGYANPANAAGAGLSNIATTLVSSPLNVLKGLFLPLAGRAHAQTDDEIAYDTLRVGDDDLATDPAGNLLPIMRQDILDIDPDKNIQELLAGEHITSEQEGYEPLSEEFKDHIKNCVESTDTISAIEAGHDCLAEQELTKKFKAHLAYLDMLDGIDAALFPEEIASGATATATSSGSTEPVKGNTASTLCAPGTIDAGEVDGYSVGQKYRIRLCEIPGFKSLSDEDPNDLVRVNSTVSGRWLEVYQGAVSANITLIANSSFRTMAKQINLYGCYKSGDCNNGNEAAKPGYSNHQIGFAVDIDIVPGKDPSLTTCRANPGNYPVYAWLAANAPPKGINATVDSECWHWAASGG